MVQNLQLAVYGVLVALSLMTYIISPPEGTIWFMITGSLGIATIMQLILIVGATGTGFGELSKETVVSLWPVI